MIDVLVAPPGNRIHLREKSEKNTQSDRPLKSLLKTISWRVVGTIDTITISFIITGEIKSALSIGSIEVVSKMILYYFHERLWSKSKRFERINNKLVDKDEFIAGIGSN